MRCEFASDNTSGICPEVWQVLAKANQGTCPSYGEDAFTERASDLFREVFETDCDVYFVFNGTAANSLALATLCQSYHSVIVHERSHVETDECGGPEFFSNGTKILLATGEQGKLDGASVEQLVTKRSDIHYPRPRVLGLTQSTELGTVYSAEEVSFLGEMARKYGLRVHMDGARLANAVAAQDVPVKELTWKAGVDVLSFGGTKNGGLSEAVVFFDRELSQEFAYRCKQAGQLASKMRFISAPWVALLRDDLWLKNATQANRCAQALGQALATIPGVRLLCPVDANAVFVELSDRCHQVLQEQGWHYYAYIGAGARFMCSWATTEGDVDELVSHIRRAYA